ncbi:aminomethyltransferase, mitochondrial [Eurosta solidaginis]|uniref:aminomethyltransferase, mitochondrial n=1 Tax=Eurosta solidaginis TaxID=178769 RepID=UPI00353104F5
MFTSKHKFKQMVFCFGTYQNNLRFSSTKGKSEHTALYDFHLKHGGKMVNFGGFILPVQYSDQSIIASHLHTRRHASIFDVSHMVQTYVRGKDAISCLESICTADIRGMTDGSGSLTVFTNDTGGILDDLIVTKVNDKLVYVVSNAAMRSQDIEIMKQAEAKFSADGKDVCIEFLTTENQSLIAVQGPDAVKALTRLLPKPKILDNLYFMHTVVSEVAGVPNCRITRCGYTGEDGVEISVPSERVQHVAEAFLADNANVKMAGLGARDSLRLEAGLCLYGNDINDQTTPVESGLAWLVAHRRRNEANFPGASIILSQLKSGSTQVKKRRVGLSMQEKEGKQTPPARAGIDIYCQDKPVGKITSGCPSPSLGKNIAMGYIAEVFRKPETLVQLKVRDILYDATVCRMPFVKTSYYVKPKI